ncbi:hypothetical protein STAFG_7678 [Streptomyces afghaniensis 772]|uniref:Uncharacterized protein n=1 Tax=Streptomyces afghaniensis 772 TaxID=1283301 RepID=S4MFM3_9ACTN|nr:hypothetical protein STAFG_7678 [Streptomyces afghaniensis 772]
MEVHVAGGPGRDGCGHIGRQGHRHRLPAVALPRPPLPLALLVDPLGVVGLLDEGAPVRGEGGQAGVGRRLGSLLRFVGLGGGAPAGLPLALPQPLGRGLGPAAVHLVGEAAALLGAQVRDVHAEHDGGHTGRPQEREPPDAATIAPRVKARNSMVVVRRRRASTFERRARAAAAWFAWFAWFVRGAAPRRAAGTCPRPRSALAGLGPGAGRAGCSGAGDGTGAWVCGRVLDTAKARTSTESVTASRASASCSPSSVERACRSLAYRRSMAAFPDRSRMAVLKRSVGRASFSSSCLRSHIGTK